MKILLINNFHFLKGGADAVYFNTAKLLKQHGHEIYYFSVKNPANTSKEYEKCFAKFHDYRKLSLIGKIKSIPSFIYNIEAYTKLMHLLDEIKPDIAHIHLFLGGLTTSILNALKKSKVPVVLSVHDYRLICPAYLFLEGENKICEQCIDRIYFRCVIKRCSEKSLSQSSMLTLDAYFRKYFLKPVNKIDRFIFVSHFIQDKHIEFDPKFKPKGRLLYNFVPDLSLIKPNESKGEYFLFYGRLSREKGLQNLIEAAILSKIILKVVGTGPLYEYYKNSNYENIEFLGFKSGDELWNLVGNASFVIVPSEWYENNPMTILEAYAYGKPVIGACIGGIPELIQHDKTGFLFDAGNKRQLFDNLLAASKMSSSQYQLLSKNAREFANKHFEPNEHYEQLLSIYKEVI